MTGQKDPQDKEQKCKAEGFQKAFLTTGGSGMPGSNPDQGTATLRFGPRRRHAQEKIPPMS
jgi:hypothetical protein